MSTRDLRGMAAVTATYVYFLLFAQYGFLRLLESRLSSVDGLKAVMGAMGLAGIALSLVSGRVLARWPAPALLRAGFGAAAVVALLAIPARGLVTHVVLAALIGASIAVVTVAIAASLRSLVPGPALGLKVGAATGVAYLLCNVPAIFSGDPRSQALVSALAAVVGLVAVPRTFQAADIAADPGREGADRWRLVAVVLSFLALIWLDSTIFATIQHTPQLKAVAWPEGSRGWLIGGVHLAAALGAGWLLDRGRFGSLPWASFALFAAGTLFGRGFGGSLLYVIGISIYSVALVVYPSRASVPRGGVPARWKAALVYGVSGWIGSALGIVTAERLERIPPQLFTVAGAALLLATCLAAGPRLVRFARAHRLTAAGGLVALLVYAVGAATVDSPAAPALSAEARGRQVYLAEGCVNCHSQYVRPGTHDVEWWGPYVEPDAGERPALIGNRRQGPDLSNVGLRRSAVWQRLHLLDPRSVFPGSTMPSYAYLFANGSSRGDDLIAYLGSLGSARAAERGDYIAKWNATTGAESVQAGGALFHRFCTPCHGSEGRGDGPLAPAIARPAMNLLKDQFVLISWGPGAEPEPQALARLVKFGMPGSTMPGHETLSAQQVADIVAYVRDLRARNGRS